MCSHHKESVSTYAPIHQYISKQMGYWKFANTLVHRSCPSQHSTGQCYHWSDRRSLLQRCSPVGSSLPPGHLQGQRLLTCLLVISWQCSLACCFITVQAIIYKSKATLCFGSCTQAWEPEEERCLSGALCGSVHRVMKGECFFLPFFSLCAVR